MRNIVVVNSFLRLVNLSVIVLLSGCSINQQTHPTIIDGTIAGETPRPPNFKRPWLEINNITDKSNNSDKVKALSISIKQLMDYSTELETYLNQYK